MLRHRDFGLVFALCCCLMAPEVAADDFAYLSVIGTAEKRGSIGTVRTEAHVTVSDGLEYDVVTVFHDRQRAIFHRTYADRTTTLGVDGKYLWSFDGEKEEEGPPFYEGFIMGHQFPAQLLFFDELNGPLQAPVEIKCGDTRCLSYSGITGLSLRVNATSLRPVGFLLVRDDGPDIEFSFDRWRDIDGVSLPFLVKIDDGERMFDYEYTSVTFNEGSMDELRAPMAVLTDEQKLMRLHRVAMDAHLLGNADLMKGSFGAEGVVVYEGEIYPTEAAGSEAMMARILSNRNYTRYDDLVRPVVKVSDDGSLGWVVVQVEAEGERFDENGGVSGPLEFKSAWISLFEKVDDEWKQIGNVSNFKPGRK